jgi:hypothetical protein
MRRVSAAILLASLTLVLAVPVSADSDRSRGESGGGHHSFSNDGRRDGRDARHDFRRDHRWDRGHQRNPRWSGEWRGRNYQYWGFDDRFRGRIDPYWDRRRFSHRNSGACPRSYLYRDRFGRLHRTQDCQAFGHDSHYFRHNRYDGRFGDLIIEIPLY